MITPDFTQYDHIHLGVSGGKDSTAVFLWATQESGIDPDRIRVTFCDTGNEDPFTYAYIDMLAETFPIATIYPKRDFWELARHKRRFPGAKSRFCTQHLKIIPSMRYINSLAQSGKTLLLSGIRKAEGSNNNNRGDLEPIRYNDLFGCDEFLPVYNHSIRDMWLMHQKHLDINRVVSIVARDADMSREHKDILIARLLDHGIPRNPLYDMGAVRVGCFPCIMSRKAEVRAMAKYRPERIEYIAEKEMYVGEVSRFGFSSFFPRETVPPRHRNQIASNGEKTYRVCSIHDVVTWSKTSHGGKQFDFDFMAKEQLNCDLRGACE